jgi:hypothetical protein
MIYPYVKGIGGDGGNVATEAERGRDMRRGVWALSLLVDVQTCTTQSIKM